MSQIVAVLTPDAIKIQSSYGYSQPLYRALMRSALIIVELLILVPAVIKLLCVLYPKQSTTTRRLYLLVFLMMPPLVFVDHGHF